MMKELILLLAVAVMDHAMASASPCIENMPATATLGIGLLHCRGGGCAVNGETPNGFEHSFTVEPSIWEIDPHGPARELQEGDEIVSIDDVLITTREGGRRLANLNAGVPVRMRIRRSNRDFNVTLVPAPGCNTPKLTVTGRSHTGRPPSPPRAAAPPVDFGMTVECGGCGWRTSGQKRTWFSTVPLSVVDVEKDGPADRAGIRDGDRIVAVDGRPLPSREGGLHLGSLQAGRPVTLTFERSGVLQDAIAIPRAARTGKL